MIENKKERELLKASRPTFINEEDDPKKKLKTKATYNVSFRGFYSQTSITNYQNNKTNTITMGSNWEDNQKVTKTSKRQK